MLKQIITSTMIVLLMLASLNQRLHATNPAAAAQPAVFKLDVRVSGETVGNGTGFLIDNAGWAVTNRHVIAGGEEFVAEFTDGTTVSSVEIWAIHDEFDLALVRLHLDRSRAALPVQTTLPTPGDDVWSVGFPKFGYTVTRGTVGGIRSYRDHFGTSSDGSLIQTDCTINPGNSGGPLLDRRGRVVGVNTWSASHFLDNTYFAIAVTHAMKMFENRPEQAMDIGTVQERAPLDHPVDLPAIDIVQDASSARMLQATQNLFRSIECSGCRGDGRVTRRRQGGYTGDGPFRRRGMRNVEERCKRCEGSGLQTRGAARHFARIAHAIPHADSADPRWENHLETTISLLSRSVGRMGKHYNALFGELAMINSAEVGDTVMVAGAVSEEFEFPGLENPIRILLTRGETVVVFRDLRFASVADGKHTVAAGILAGKLELGDSSYPVVQYGFMVSTRD